MARSISDAQDPCPREVSVSIWHTPTPVRPHIPAHHVTAQDLAIFAGGMIVAMLVGIAATGILPV
jgi:hypothetical protein